MYRRFNDTKCFVKKWSDPLTLDSTSRAVTPPSHRRRREFDFCRCAGVAEIREHFVLKGRSKDMIFLLEIEVRTATNLFDENGGSWGIHERVDIPIGALDLRKPPGRLRRGTRICAIVRRGA